MQQLTQQLINLFYTLDVIERTGLLRKHCANLSVVRCQPRDVAHAKWLMKICCPSELELTGTWPNISQREKTLAWYRWRSVN